VEVYYYKTLQQAFNVVLVQIYAKNAKFGYINPILGTLGVMHDLVVGSLESP